MNTLSLLKRYPRYLGFGFLHYFFSFIGQTFFISLFVAGITAERGWTTEQFAGLYSGVTLVAAFILPVVGRQIDRLRVRTISTANALMMLSGCLLLGLSYHWMLLPLGLLAVRLGGQGIMVLTGSTTIGRFFVKGRGQALAISIVGISAAETIIPPVATAFISENGYRSMWLLAAGLLAAVFLPLIWVLIRKHDLFQRAATVAEAQKEKEVGPSWTRGQVLRDRRFQLIIPTFLFLPFVFTGFVFNQSDIAGMRGFSLEQMAFGLSIFGLTRLIVLLSAGYFIDRIGAGKILPFLLLPAVVGILVFVNFSGAWVIAAFFSLMALTGGVITVAAPTLWADRYGPLFLGGIKSTVKLLEILSSAAAPLVFSWGIGWNLPGWLLVIVGYGLMCFLLALREKRIPDASERQA